MGREFLHCYYSLLFCIRCIIIYLFLIVKQPQKCVSQIQQARKSSREFPLGTKGHSVVSWSIDNKYTCIYYLWLEQLNARGGKVSFLPPLVTACVTLVRTYI